ncbi:hypothetical protein KP509_08G063000 [Ceratopteris richardii]|uniref:B30.2/SPRY domain-containing protein n=1 Tax=Ceratopteris richardii TaxID=49495 RepID=A0A8T2UAK3_CERRI|nr:hypothetical protein KP509_08G063000 [Ceratopteris richardii]
MEKVTSIEQNEAINSCVRTLITADNRDELAVVQNYVGPCSQMEQQESVDCSLKDTEDQLIGEIGRLGEQRSHGRAECSDEHVRDVACSAGNPMLGECKEAEITKNDSVHELTEKVPAVTSHQTNDQLGSTHREAQRTVTSSLIGSIHQLDIEEPGMDDPDTAFEADCETMAKCLVRYSRQASRKESERRGHVKTNADVEQSGIEEIHSLQAEESEKKDSYTSSETDHQDTGNDMSVAMPGKIGSTFISNSDELKDCGGAGDACHSPARFETEEYSKGSTREDTSGHSRNLQKNLGDFKNLSSGSLQSTKILVTVEERTKSSAPEPADNQGYANVPTMFNTRRADGEHLQDDMQTSEESGEFDAEMQRGLRGTQELANHGEQCNALDYNRVNSNEGLRRNLVRHVTDREKEQRLISMMLHSGQKMAKTHSDREPPQSKLPEITKGDGKLKEGFRSTDGIASMADAEGFKADLRESSKPHIRMNVGMMISEDQKVGQTILQGSRCYESKAVVPDQEKGYAFSARDEAKSHKEYREPMKDGQKAQAKETANQKFGHDTWMSSAVSSSQQFLSSNNIISDAPHRDLVQLKRHQAQKKNSDMAASPQAWSLPRELEGIPRKFSRETPVPKKKDNMQGSSGQQWRIGIVMKVKSNADTVADDRGERGEDIMNKNLSEENEGWDLEGTSYNKPSNLSVRHILEEQKTVSMDETNAGTSEEEKFFRVQHEKVAKFEKGSQKRKSSENVISDCGTANEPGQTDNVVKKAKKKTVNVWAKTTSRKGPKKNSKNGGAQNPLNEDSVLLTPVFVNPDRVEDGPDQSIALSKYDKAERIELSEDRLTASSTKGYRMVRATRGVQEGAWYFEISVRQLGDSGHTRLGWSTQKGDVQAPVGFDSNSYGYRDVDGSKTHVAVREPYGSPYVENDVIGFYIHLPNGAEYAPKPAPLLSYRGRPYLSDVKEEDPGKVPGR